MDQPKRELTRQEKWMYIMGYIVLAITAFWGRDFTNMDEMINGVIIFGMFTAFSIFWFYFSERGGLGYPIWG